MGENYEHTRINLLHNGQSSFTTVGKFLRQSGYILEPSEPFWYNSEFYGQPKMFIGDMNGKLVMVGPYLAGDGVEINYDQDSPRLGEIRLRYPLPVLSGNSGKVLTVNEAGDNIEWAYTGIDHGTTEYWRNRGPFIPDAGKLIIYDDYYTDEQGVVYAGMKIGTGNAYLSDLPFLIDEKNIYTYLNEFYIHIRNTQIHVSPEDRIRWDNKLNLIEEVNDEVLIFNRK